MAEFLPQFLDSFNFIANINPQPKMYRGDLIHKHYNIESSPSGIGAQHPKVNHCHTIDCNKAKANKMQTALGKIGMMAKIVIKAG